MPSKKGKNKAAAAGAAPTPALPQLPQHIEEIEPGIAIEDDMDPSKFPTAPSIGLSVVGFCGVDDSVCIQTVCELSQEYSFIEWGVLLHPERQGKPRYASIQWLHRLRDEVERRQQKALCIKSKDQVATRGSNMAGPWSSSLGKNKSTSYSIRLAAHLGGDYCLQALRGEGGFIKNTLVEQLGFTRIQLNPTKPNGVSETSLRKYLESFRQLAVSMPDIQFILQVNRQTKDLAFPLMDDPLPNLAFLYDSSMGCGRTPSRRPVPIGHPGVHIGYAGGLGPHNLRDELRKITTAVMNSQQRGAGCEFINALANGMDLPQMEPQERTIWIDMESSLRRVDPEAKTDVFDIDQCNRVIGQLCDLGVLPADE
ncbi:unnamed protein product [Amoebophrya sp. A25]|nr:unnamed protein product [Amoebophrya sp. A25]|eukprot:GSA25T00011411001.1